MPFVLVNQGAETITKLPLPMIPALDPEHRFPMLRAQRSLQNLTQSQIIVDRIGSIAYIFANVSERNFKVKVEPSSPPPP